MLILMCLALCARWRHQLHIAAAANPIELDGRPVLGLADLADVEATRAIKKAPAVEPSVHQHFAEHYAHARIVRLLRRSLAVCLVLWLGFGAVYSGAMSDRYAAIELRSECHASLVGAPLQSCLEAAHKTYLASAGPSGTMEALLWIVGIL